MDIIQERLPRREQDEDMLEDCPWKRQRGCCSKYRLVEDQDECKAQGPFNGGYDDEVEEHQAEELGESRGVAGRQGGAPAVLDAHCEARQRDVEE